MIKRIGPNKYVIMDKEGKKKLSKAMSRKRAIRRLKQIEYFKKGDA